MKALFLTTVLPNKKLHGSEIASQNIIDALNQIGYQVTVVGYGRKEDGKAEPAAHEILVSERSIETKKAKLNAIFWLVDSFIKRLPYSSAKYQSRQYIKTVRSLLSRDKFDLIVVDHAQLAWIKHHIPKNRTIFVAHNIEHQIYVQHSQQAENVIAQWIYAREATLVKQMEEHLAQAVDEVWALTQHDAAYFATVATTVQVRELPLPSSFTYFQPRTSAPSFDIGLIGSWSWKPNEAGLLWFLQQVYPHLPSPVSIHIAGKGLDWQPHQYSNITYHGFVPDAQEFMMQAKVVAIPILSGGGIQIKTLDAIASGSTIVATPFALRGITHPPSTVQMAAQPQEFAQCLVSSLAAPAAATEKLEEVSSWFVSRRRQFIAEVAASTYYPSEWQHEHRNLPRGILTKDPISQNYCI
jgi:hypothetical protein